ncbi:MAG: ComEC/Rec2 family competence protein [Sphingobium phenoxybenzoativorans]
MAFEPRQTSTNRWGGLSFSVLFSVIERWLEKEREHIALWAPVALGGGIAAWFLLPGPFAWMGWCFLCAALIVAAGLIPAGSRLRMMLAAAGFLACIGCLIIWGKAVAFGEPPLARAAFVQMTGRITHIEPLPAQGSTRLVLKPLERPDLPARIRVNIADADRPEGLAEGAIIAFRARMMPPAPPAVPGAYDFAQRAFFMGIGATGKALPPIKIVETPADGGPSLRQRLSTHIQARVEGGPGAIAATLATGDRGAIPENDAEAMRRSGLAHLLSISGLHVTALIGAVIFLILRLLALSSRLALRWPLLLLSAAGGAAAGIGYTLLTGSDVPTVRSCVAALLVLGGLALGRDSLTLRLVAAGALFILLLWPESIAGPSFQMSFTAVTVIVALGEHPRFRALVSAREERMPVRFLRHLLGLFLTGLAIEIALMPIALFHFHQAGMLGAIANLIAIPLTTFIIMPFEALALFLDLAGLGFPAWWIVEKALALLLIVAHAVAASPGAVALTPAISPVEFGLTVAGGLWCLLWRSRARWIGLLPVLAGAAMIAMTPKPDIMVTGDGRHVAIRLPDGGMAILRDKAGDYVRDALSESAGYDGELAAFADIPAARCSRDLCNVDMVRGERRWRMLATRSFDLVPASQLARDCAAADVVVSERRLPRTCNPRWLKIDRSMLRRTGGVAVYLRQGVIKTVKRKGDAHPWMTPPSHYSQYFRQKAGNIAP